MRRCDSPDRTHVRLSLALGRHSQDNAAPIPASPRQTSNGTLETQNPLARFAMIMRTYPVVQRSFGPLHTACQPTRANTVHDTSSNTRASAPWATLADCESRMLLIRAGRGGVDESYDLLQVPETSRGDEEHPYCEPAHISPAPSFGDGVVT